MDYCLLKVSIDFTYSEMYNYDVLSQMLVFGIVIIIGETRSYNMVSRLHNYVTKYCQIEQCR